MTGNDKLRDYRVVFKSGGSLEFSSSESFLKNIQISLIDANPTWLLAGDGNIMIQLDAVAYFVRLPERS